jgi:hypothetical protein
MVSFSEIEYHVALNKGKEQDEVVLNMIKKNNITQETPSNKLDELIHQFYGEKIKN